jgi:hypothetical protein
MRAQPLDARYRGSPPSCLDAIEADTSIQDMDQSAEAREIMAEIDEAIKQVLFQPGDLDDGGDLRAVLAMSIIVGIDAIDADRLALRRSLLEVSRDQ